MLTSPFISSRNARGPPKAQRTPFTRPFLELHVTNSARGHHISTLNERDWLTEIDVIPRNAKPTQRVKRCLGDRENVSGRAFHHWPKMSSTHLKLKRASRKERFTLTPKTSTDWCPRVVFFASSRVQSARRWVGVETGRWKEGVAFALLFNDNHYQYN